MKTHYLPRDWKLEHFESGPWMDEPDHAEWRHHTTGMPCIVVRIPTGAWAGYVGVAVTHPFYRVSHRELKLVENVVVSNHGYGCIMADGTEVEVEADKAYWFFGFDYSHGGDVIPQHEVFRNHSRWAKHPGEAQKYPLRSRGEGSWDKPAYADFTYVRMRAERLSEQLEHPEDVERVQQDREDDE